MALTTITEALAELKTIDKRLQKKREYIKPYLWRQEGLKDPLEKDGGSAQVIARERQAIKDLEERVIAIRTTIQKTNIETALTVGEETRTLQGWLNWRKEVAQGQAKFITDMRQAIQTTRAAANQRGVKVLGAGETPGGLLDINVNVDEAELAKEAERIETVLGTLDGKLSLLNATTTIDV